MSEASRYPIDFDALKRGDCVPASAIEESLSVSRDDADYHWKLLALRDQVVQHFMQRGDAGVVVTTCDGGLQVLTDEQAVHYVQRRDRKARRDMAWSLLKASAIDRAKLTNETRKLHDEFVVKASWRMQQLRKRPPQLGEGA